MSRTLPAAPCAARWLSGAALVCLVAVVLGGPAAPRGLAQDPRLLLGSAPQKYAEATNVLLAQVPGKKQSVLWLRPNTEGQFFLFVSNPTAADRTFRVSLVDRGGKTLSTAPDVTVPSGQTVPVPQPEAAPPPKPAAAEPGAKPAPGKEEAAGWLEGKGLPAQFTFRLTEAPKKADEKPAPPADEVRVGFILPARYLKVTQPTYAAEGPRISVTVEGTPDFRGEPCPVKMKLELEDPVTGALKEFTPAEGALQLPVAPGKGAVELFARDPAFATLGKTKGYLTLSADDYERAFRYSIDFSGASGAEAIKELKAARVELRAPPYALPGARFPVRLGLDNLDAVKPGRKDGEEPDPLADEVVLRLDFGRWEVKKDRDGKETTKLTAYNTQDLPGHRFQRVALNPRAPDGAVAFRTRVRDWETEEATRGVFGTSALCVQVLRGEVAQRVEGSKGTPPAVCADVILDASPPVLVSGGPAGKELVRGEPLKVVATVKVPPSKIRSVTFFVGKPVPDPKVPGAFLVPEGAARVAAKRKDPKSDAEWQAVLAEVPTDKKNKVEIGVEVISNVGLRDLGNFTVQLVEPKTTFKISGTVFEGQRPQPGVLVQLKDATGAVKAETFTDDKDGKVGHYELTDVPPGIYVVTAFKKKSATKGETPIQVKAGDKPKDDVNISLLR